MYDDFGNDGKSEIAILDGGQCSFGIESTVLKIYEIAKDDYELLILRRGGVSEKKISDVIT